MPMPTAASLRWTDRDLRLYSTQLRNSWASCTETERTKSFRRSKFDQNNFTMLCVVNKKGTNFLPVVLKLGVELGNSVFEISQDTFFLFLVVGEAADSDFQKTSGMSKTRYINI